VSLKPAVNAPLDDERVKAIRKLVAAAVAGMKPENVTVTDSSAAAPTAASRTIPARETSSMP